MAEEPPFDSPHLYVQWGGALPGPEQWSCGLRLRKKSAGAIDSGAGLLVGVGAAIATFHTSADAQISAAAKLDFVKVNAIGTNGRYSGAGTNQALYTDAGDGSAIQKYPNQIAWAVTLTTGFNRGPAHKGRFYLPLPDCYISGADGRVSAAAAEQLHGAVTTLLASLNAVNADYEVAVFSRNATAPGNRKVTGNAIGRVLDTQRRRRRSQVEDYQS